MDSNLSMTASAGLGVTEDPTGTGQPDTFYLHERYVERATSSPLMNGYYALKPLLPRRVQIALRRAYARRQAQRTFPAWPCEPVLVRREQEQFRRRIRESGADRMPFVNFWPESRRFAVVLTHDVEGPAGIRNIPRVLEVERRHGFVSSWNFVAEGYDIPDGVFDSVREAGCEVGLHGIKHDASLFRSRASFDEQLPKIHRYLREWDVVGFRSPATHRNADWMPELGCLYDSSFPDTDPFEPQPGGCCSIFPFRLGDLVELPTTLVQDHTLWEILRQPSIDRWVEKTRWIAGHHGLVNLILHPDYVLDPERLSLYESFLRFLAGQADSWHALPRDVATWWREREGLRVVGDSPRPRVEGPASFRATVAWAREEAGDVVFDH
jgi:peptidoglycan/xylan/chitin deacetylase (PgdA/CDA1 family)